MRHLIPSLIQDVRYAIRQLWKSPGFTITAVLTLAIGIGANAGGFSIMDAVVLRPLAVPDLKQVVVVNESKNHGEAKQVALANFEDWQHQNRSFEEIAVRQADDMSLTGAGDAVHVQAEYLSPSFFRVLRANALIGRLFTEAETQPGANSVAVLGYAFWKAHFAGDTTVVGRQVELDQHAYTVIGVMPKSMQYPSMADVLLPFAPTAGQLADRGAHNYLVLGRMRKGVTIQEAQADLNTIAEHLAGAYPVTNQGWGTRVEPLLNDVNGEYTPLYMELVQGATLFVLLVVCANIGNLQFARGIQRRPEIAMRTALGARRSRLMRQLLTENLILGLLGGLGGLLVAWAYMQVSLSTMPPHVARYMAGWSNIRLNGRTLVFSLLLAVGAGLASGFAPALEALRINLVAQLKSGSRAVVGAGRGHRMRNLLATAQVALAVTLVIGAALMTKGMMGMMHLADVYQPARTLTFDVQLPAARYNTPEKQAQWYADSLTRLRALPGVQSAEITQSLPYSDYAWLDEFRIENRPVAPGQSQSAQRIPVSAGLFASLHIPLLSGRGFAAGDGMGAQPVAVVSRNFGPRFFPGENVLGKRIRMGGNSDANAPWLTIVGVVDDVSYSLWDRSRPAAIYTSEMQVPRPDMTYAIVTSGDPQALAPTVRKALAGLDPNLPLDSVQSYTSFMHDKLTGIFEVAGMLSFDALVALLLAAIGIFGVMANLVGERTREIGVRLAMGAQRADVLSMILRRAAWLTGVGVCVGLVLAFALAHGVANLLYQVSPNDPLVFGSITLTVIAVAFLSSWLPALRAARIDPMVALRDE